MSSFSSTDDSRLPLSETFLSLSLNLLKSFILGPPNDFFFFGCSLAFFSCDFRFCLTLGELSSSESIVQLIDGTPYVTLLCNDLLIEKTNFTNKSDVNVYRVSKWNEEKKENSEKKVLYNCEENGKLVFPEYYEELYFVYELNKKYGSSYYYSNDVKKCKVVSKTFYRTKKAIK